MQTKLPPSLIVTYLWPVISQFNAGMVQYDYWLFQFPFLMCNMQHATCNMYHAHDITQEIQHNILHVSDITNHSFYTGEGTSKSKFGPGYPPKSMSVPLESTNICTPLEGDKHAARYFVGIFPNFQAFCRWLRGFVSRQLPFPDDCCINAADRHAPSCTVL